MPPNPPRSSIFAPVAWTTSLPAKLLYPVPPNATKNPDWIGSHLTEVWLHYHRRGEGKTVLYKCKPTNKFRSHLEILTHFTDFTELQQGIHMVRMSM